MQSDVRDSLSFFDTFLLVFAGIGLVVACFTIYNTFQVIVTQRAKEMALLRAVGATRRQVLQAQLVEASLVGLLASVVGLGRRRRSWPGCSSGCWRRFGIDIPAGGTVFQTRTAVVALVVGTLGDRALGRRPVAAGLADPAAGGAARRHRRPLQPLARAACSRAALVTAAGAAAPARRLGGVGASAGSGSAPSLVFIGVFVLGPLIARPVVPSSVAPSPRLSGVTGELARENAGRSPKRTARTGGALMVGVALVAAITIIAASAKDWIHDVWSDQFTGDFVVTTQSVGYGGLSPEVAQQLAALPEVGTATGIRTGVATFSTDARTGRDQVYVAVDPATAGRLFDIGMTSGSIADLTDRRRAPRRPGSGRPPPRRSATPCTSRFLDGGVTRPDGARASTPRTPSPAGSSSARRCTSRAAPTSSTSPST